MSGSNAMLKNVVGFLAFLAAWELAGRFGWLGPSFPALSDILATFGSDRSRGLLMRAMNATVYASCLAFLIGAVAALLLTLITAILPATEKGLDTFASGLYAVPTIAFGPVLILLVGHSNTAILLGALSTYFPIYVALTSALRFAPPVYADLSQVLGASPTRAFFRLSLPFSVPAFIDGLRLGAPAAVLGVILGEWFGATRGLGVLIISSLQNVRITQLWAAALLSIACTFGAYLLLTLLYRWALSRFSWS